MKGPGSSDGSQSPETPGALRDALAECSPLRFLFPPCCELCDQPLDVREHRDAPCVCRDCAAGFQLIEKDYCQVCGKAYSGAFLQPLECANCRGRNLAFDFALGVCQGDEKTRDLMHRYKYSRQIHLARLFGKLLARVWLDPRLDSSQTWTVVPVPLHRKRFRKRGFNQAREIAKVFRRHSPEPKNLKVRSLLRRARHTDRQAQLDREERLRNLGGAFAPARVARSRATRFLLVDDVLTTGTTASECASVLRSAFGAEIIVAIAVLRG